MVALCHHDDVNVTTYHMDRTINVRYFRDGGTIDDA
jgi:hypothetical protein